MSNCPCKMRLPLEWGQPPLGTQLYEVEFEEKLNGLTWTLRLVVRCLPILSVRGVLFALYASPMLSTARTRNRELPINAVIKPACDGGSEISMRLLNKEVHHFTRNLAPLAYVLRNKFTMTHDYAQYGRALQPVHRRARQLLTTKDRQILLCAFLCLRRLPIEIREFILTFLNLKDLGN